jgi:hypothetical protein
LQWEFATRGKNSLKGKVCKDSAVQELGAQPGKKVEDQSLAELAGHVCKTHPSKVPGLLLEKFFPEPRPVK